MQSNIFIAGHRGMVGSALLRKLSANPETNLVTRSRAELGLTRQSEVESFFADEKIDVVYLAAARVGGIKANNDFPADFIRENLQIQTNVIHSAYRAGVSRLLFLGSSCIYPRLASQPIREDALMTGPLESTNEAYAVAKIAGLVAEISPGRYQRRSDRGQWRAQITLEQGVRQTCDWMVEHWNEIVVAK